MIADPHMVIVVALALLGTFLCRQADIIVDLPADLVSIAVIFPVVFSISSAYARREDALKSFAALKGDAASLYYAHRDWPSVQSELAGAGAALIHDLLSSIGRYFTAPPNARDQALRAVYRSCSAVSASYRDMLNGGATRSEVSRLGAYLRDVMVEFERMRNYNTYRTPITLRAFSRFFLTLLPLMFTPYFAYVGYPDDAWIGYAVALMYGVVLVGLDNVQEQLENPYDGIGPDDLHLLIADDYVSMLTGETNLASPRLVPALDRAATDSQD
ncbi:MAG: hypothetical protein AB7P33_15490 [Dehalococcoidia bacterium]